MAFLSNTDKVHSDQLLKIRLWPLFIITFDFTTFFTRTLHAHPSILQLDFKYPKAINSLFGFSSTGTMKTVYIAVIFCNAQLLIMHQPHTSYNLLFSYLQKQGQVWKMVILVLCCTVIL